jgi:hypothetical protein
VNVAFRRNAIGKSLLKNKDERRGDTRVARQFGCTHLGQASRLADLYEPRNAGIDQ